MYYNYHGQIIKKIKNHELVDYEFKDSYHHITDVLLLYFKDGQVKPIRSQHFMRYMILIEKYLPDKKK